MSKLLEKWMTAQRDLGLDIVAPYAVRLSDTVELRAEFLVKNFGGPTGMLVIKNYAQVKPYLESLQSLGYGFSVLEEPKDKLNQTYDRETVIDILSDWGWTGPQADKPQWLRDPE